MFFSRWRNRSRRNEWRQWPIFCHLATCVGAVTFHNRHFRVRPFGYSCEFLRDFPLHMDIISMSGRWVHTCTPVRANITKRKVTGGWYRLEKAVITPQARPRQGERRVWQPCARCRFQVLDTFMYAIFTLHLPRQQGRKRTRTVFLEDSR